MHEGERAWVVVLAAGRNARPAASTSADGAPWRYRRADGAPSPVAQTLARALRLAPAERVLAVVDRTEARWWRAELAALRAENVIALPRDRGTAVAVLLPFLHVMHRAPNDVVLVLSADEPVADETALHAAALRAITAACSPDNRVILLGHGPEGCPPGAVRIVPVPGDDATVGARPVEAVTEVAADGGGGGCAADLLGGATLAARVSGILRLYERSAPWLLRAFLPSLAQRWWWRPWTLAELFDLVPHHEFPRDVARRAADLLRVVSVPANAWAELPHPLPRGRQGGRDLSMTG